MFLYKHHWLVPTIKLIWGFVCHSHTQSFLHGVWLCFQDSYAGFTCAGGWWQDRAACQLHLIIYEAMLVPAYYAGILYACVCGCYALVCLERKGLLTSLFFCSQRDKPGSLLPPAWIFPFIFCLFSPFSLSFKMNLQWKVSEPQHWQSSGRLAAFYQLAAH